MVSDRNPWGMKWSKSLRGIYGGNPSGGEMEEILGVEMEEILGGRDRGNPWCRDGGNPWGERWRKSLRGVYGGNP